VRVAVGSPYYYPGYYYPGFYSWGWPGYGFWGYPPYPYYWPQRYDRTGAARLEVSPKAAQVFVDGYFVGEVDDFDGTFQRLRVEAGEHELSFYLDGYRTETQKVLFRREGTLNLALALQPLPPGETSERPAPDPNAPPGQEPPAGAREMRRPDMPPPGANRNTDFGTLSILVQPSDAEILVDGQRWDGSDPGARLEIQLADGSHRVEVRKEGYRPYTANLRIRRGETQTLNISLNQDP
jgi:hypothetical protein